METKKQLRSQLRTANALIRQLTKGCESALVALQEDRYEIVALQDELNAKNIVVEGAIAKVRVLEEANVQAQAYAQKAQQVIMDLAEDLAELTEERNDLAALVEDYEYHEDMELGGEG